jgi:hypothetical protein
MNLMPVFTAIIASVWLSEHWTIYHLRRCDDFGRYHFGAKENGKSTRVLKAPLNIK